MPSHVTADTAGLGALGLGFEGNKSGMCQPLVRIAANRHAGKSAVSTMRNATSISETSCPPAGEVGAHGPALRGEGEER